MNRITRFLAFLMFCAFFMTSCEEVTLDELIVDQPELTTSSNAEGLDDAGADQNWPPVKL